MDKTYSDWVHNPGVCVCVCLYVHTHVRIYVHIYNRFFRNVFLLTLSKPILSDNFFLCLPL